MTYIECNKLDSPLELILVNQNTINFAQAEGKFTRLHFNDNTSFVITCELQDWNNRVKNHSDD